MGFASKTQENSKRSNRTSFGCWGGASQNGGPWWINFQNGSKGKQRNTPRCFVWSPSWRNSQTKGRTKHTNSCVDIVAISVIHGGHMFIVHSRQSIPEPLLLKAGTGLPRFGSLKKTHCRRGTWGSSTCAWHCSCVSKRSFFWCL